MSKQDGGPAFPHFGLYRGADGNHHIEPAIYSGLSLRDYFAGQALAGLLANPMGFSKSEDYSKHAYKHADTMLAERDKP